MLLRAILLWVAGLLTIVPWSLWYLFCQAEPTQYAWLILLILFWVFGYWSVAGPIIAILKVRAIYRTIVELKAQGDLLAALRRQETEEIVVDLIARQNRIPRFLATRVYRLLVRHFATEARTKTNVT